MKSTSLANACCGLVHRVKSANPSTPPGEAPRYHEPDIESDWVRRSRARLQPPVHREAGPGRRPPAARARLAAAVRAGADTVARVAPPVARAGARAAAQPVAPPAQAATAEAVREEPLPAMADRPRGGRVDVRRAGATGTSRGGSGGIASGGSGGGTGGAVPAAAVPAAAVPAARAPTRAARRAGGSATGGTAAAGPAGASPTGGSGGGGGATDVCPKPQAQACYYVAPTGSDTNPGTVSAPFQTLTKARDIVRTINASMTQDIYVYLRGGDLSHHQHRRLRSQRFGDQRPPHLLPGVIPARRRS